MSEHRAEDRARAHTWPIHDCSKSRAWRRLSGTEVTIDMYSVEVWVAVQVMGKVVSIS